MEVIIDETPYTPKWLDYYIPHQPYKIKDVNDNYIEIELTAELREFFSKIGFTSYPSILHYSFLKIYSSFEKFYDLNGTNTD